MFEKINTTKRPVKGILIKEDIEPKDAKYEIVEDQIMMIMHEDPNTNLFTKRTLKRIRALKNFKTINDVQINKGDLGGYVESYDNLSQYGTCWIFDTSMVYDGGLVLDKAIISESSIIRNKSIVCNDSVVKNECIISGNTTISGNSLILNNMIIASGTKFKDMLIDGYTLEITSNSLLKDRHNKFVSSVYGYFANVNRQ